MGLRINTNVSSFGALRNLQRADAAQQTSLERLSTGLRINRASDDPSGFVISERLRAQIRGMEQAAKNSQNASNLIGTAEAALSEVNSLLMDIRESVVFAMNSGGNDPGQVEAEQYSIDNALRSIDRIAQTTRFATRNLLDGSSGITTSNANAIFEDISVSNVSFDDMSTTSQTYTLNVTTTAEQANISDAAGGNFGTFVSTTGATLRLTGSQGTRDVTLMNGMTVAQFDEAVNTFTSETGLTSNAGVITSVDYGSAQTASLEVLSGSVTTSVGAVTSGVFTDTGADLVGDVNGIAVNANGFDVNVVSDILTAKFRVATTAANATAYNFDVNNEGLIFQLNQSASTADREQVGLKNVSSSVLGSVARTVTGQGGQSLTVGGFLSSLMSGSSNDLSTNAANALRIVDEAISEISDHRAYLGAFQSQTIDTNLNSLNVAIENLTASESAIRDLDFARESADFTRNQILYQSGIAVLAQSNLISQSVLSLLG
jgi:flagellin